MSKNGTSLMVTNIRSVWLSKISINMGYLKKFNLYKKYILMNHHWYTLQKTPNEFCDQIKLISWSIQNYFSVWKVLCVDKEIIFGNSLCKKSCTKNEKMIVDYNIWLVDVRSIERQIQRNINFWKTTSSFQAITQSSLEPIKDPINDKNWKN